MSTLIYHVLSIGILLMISTMCECVRMRRAGIAGYDDPYGLTNAFSDMDRPRRADYRTLLRKRVLENDDSYFNPNEGSSLDIDPMDYLRASRYSDNLGDFLSDRDFQRAAPSFDTLQRYSLPLSFSDSNDRGYGPQKRTAYKPRRVVPTLEELRTIFGEADVPMKRLAVKRQEPTKDSEETIEVQDTETETNESEKDEKDVASEWGRLIEAAEQLTMNSGGTETIQETAVEDNNDKQIDKDLEAVLSDSEVGTETDEEDETDDTNDQNLEESPVSGIIEETQAQSKSKRASSVGDSSDYVLGLLKEISDLKRTLYAQDMIQELQSRENDYLANALKFATMDQIEEGDKFVVNEYNNVAKATETEELIQELADGLEAEEEEESEEDDEMDDAIMEDLVEPEVKRSDVNTFEGEQWLEAPVEEKVGTGALIEDLGADEDDEIDDEDFERTESLVDVPYIADDIEDEEEEEEEEAYENAVADIAGRENDETSEGQEILLAKLISNLSPGTLERVISDLEEREEENGICPPVLELSQNCAFADAKGIPIDAEARSLCVRHQLCYTCGSAIGISPERCDNGYKGTVIAECEDDSKCMRAAAFFLHLMTSRFHNYEEYSPRECANPCVADFIYGV